MSQSKFNIQLSQELDDGDIALREEHTNVDGYYAQDIINEYGKRAMSRPYVVSYTAIVKRC